MKRYFRYTAVLLGFATAVTLFAACSKNNDNSGEADTTATTVYVPSEFKTDANSIYTEDGKIYMGGNELITDSNGVTVIDESGNLIQKVTDAQGNEVTQPVTFPSFINEGSRVACQQFTITCPSGWESSGNLNFRLRNSAENKQIEYSFRDKADEKYKTADEEYATLEKTFKSMIDDGSAILTKSATTVAGKNAVKIVLEFTGENPSYMETYCVEDGNGMMCFNCFCNYEDKDFDFKAILDTIEYRVK